MIPVRLDREAIELRSEEFLDLGGVLRALEPRTRGRVITSVLLNGWERIDASDGGANTIPAELISDVWIETESMDQAVERALRSAGQLAIVAATTASRAGEAFQEGRDGEGHLGFGELCRFASDLELLAETLRGVQGPVPAARSFVEVWRGRCAAALSQLVTAGEADDKTLMADHLLYDVAPALTALGSQGCPA